MGLPEPMEKPGTAFCLERVMMILRALSYHDAAFPIHACTDLRRRMLEIETLLYGQQNGSRRCAEVKERSLVLYLRSC